MSLGTCTNGEVVIRFSLACSVCLSVENEAFESRHTRHQSIVSQSIKSVIAKGRLPTVLHETTSAVLDFRFAPIDLSVLHDGYDNDSPVQQSSSLGSGGWPGSKMAAKPSKPSWRKIMARRRRQRLNQSLRHQMDYEEQRPDIFKSIESMESWNNNNSRLSKTGGGNEKVTSLMAACHQGLEHNVSKILWRKVLLKNLETFFNAKHLIKWAVHC